MSGNRTSIFETFSMPHTSLSTQSTSRPSNIIRYSAEDEGSNIINIDENDDDYENSAFNDVEEIENCGDDNGTLWMSCSPGRDSGEEEESCNSSVIYEPMNVMDFQPTEKYIPIETVEEVEESSPLKLKFKVKELKAKDHINNEDNFNKPLSSYALFFRDTQIAIKDQNPDISFGEISRVVATMWDNLDANHKQYYNKLAEEAKLSEKSPKKEKLIHSHHHREKVPSKKSPKDKHQANERSDKPAFAKRQTKTISYKCFAEKVTTKCTREGCSNKAVDDPRWSKEYCSTLCVVSHCKDVYKAWVALRKSSTTKTKT